MALRTVVRQSHPRPICVQAAGFAGGDPTATWKTARPSEPEDRRSGMGAKKTAESWEKCHRCHGSDSGRVVHNATPEPHGDSALTHQAVVWCGRLASYLPGATGSGDERGTLSYLSRNSSPQSKPADLILGSKGDWAERLWTSFELEKSQCSIKQKSKADGFPTLNACLCQAFGSAARTISTSTLRASSEFWTSRRKLTRVPFMPSPVFSLR